MALIVQKFGGTSVATSEKILAAARKAIRTQQLGHQVVMVVSAMGHNTDMLIDLAKQVNDEPPAREMDALLSTGEQVSVALMAMAVSALGSKAVSLVGAQIGIVTDSTHTKARIKSISTDRIRQALADGNIAIAAGFQGIDEHNNITTLGRGGSDTTAVALAAVLEADACEIYTDVDGVYTCDPRLLPEARMVSRISYDEMLELASLGAGVMHNRAVEFAKRFHVPIHVRNAGSDRPGTMIESTPESATIAVCGAALIPNEARLSIMGVPDKPGTLLSIFSRIAERHIPVDMIVQNVGDSGKADVSFTVIRDDLRGTLAALEAGAVEVRAAAWSHDDDVAKVSVVGLGMARQTGVATRTFAALAQAGINILMITTSEIKISVLVKRAHAKEALRTLHRAFALEQEPPNLTAPQKEIDQRARRTALDIVANFQGMEDLTVSEIMLDETQARITMRDVPDVPGIAAAVFERIGAEKIFVDMIVQNFGLNGRAHLSFTVPQSDLARAELVAQEISKSLGGKGVSSARRIAKISVTGLGLRSQRAGMIRMFEVMSESGINIEMINTSEVRINVVVDGAQGAKALECIQKAFKGHTFQ